MKIIFKQILRAAFIIIVTPLLAAYFISSIFSSKDRVFPSFSHLLSLAPGLSGCYLRAAFYRFTLDQCEPDVHISFLTILSHRQTEIGSNVYIGPQCNIGLCKIEKDTLIGSGVHILSGKNQHSFTDLKRPIKEQGGFFEKITIGQNCWLGNTAVIMAEIEEGVIVAAGSVVKESVTSFSIVGGNPALLLKSRQ